MISIFKKHTEPIIISQMDYITIKLKETNSDFLVHVSSMNHDWKNIDQWEVIIEHEEQNWKGTINSADPNAFICASGLSGWFRIKVRIKMNNNSDWIEIGTKRGYKNRIRSFPNSVSLLIIEANEHLEKANFYVIGNSVYSSIREKSFAI